MNLLYTTPTGRRVLDRLVRMALTIVRRSLVRGRPSRRGGGNKVSSIAHSRSVMSLV